MFDKKGLEAVLQEQGMPLDGQKLVLKARVQAPVRGVESRGGNVLTVFMSQKMGCEIRTESRNYEFAAAVDFEFDNTVLAYYPQPCELRLELIDPLTGEIHKIQHTPDFLRVTKAATTLIECKSQAELQRLAQKYPWRYKQDSDGHFYAPLIEGKLAELGLSYSVLTEKQVSARRIENLLHLADYLHPAAEKCPKDVLERVNVLLQEHGHLYVSELLGQPHCFSADHINQALADRSLVTDLDVEVLTEPSRCRIFRDEALMRFVHAGDAHPVNYWEKDFSVDIVPGAKFQFGGEQLTIQLVDAKDFICRAPTGPERKLSIQWLENGISTKEVKLLSAGKRQSFSHYSEQELKVAHERLEQVHSDNPALCSRTIARRKAAMRAAELHGLLPVQGLMPKTAQRGNRTPRLSDEQSAAMEQVFKQSWCTNVAMNYKTCHRLLEVLCNELQITPPSCPTFTKYIKDKTGNRERRERKGRRQAYQLDTFVTVLYADSPRHGSRAFQYVHIDHTQLDIELVGRKTGKNLGRPWLTICVDADTRVILAIYLTYDPPSYVSVMMVIRELVKRHKRLPEFFVVDNGKDLVCSSFEAFLGAMGVHLRKRPSGQPRFGAVIERLFGTLNHSYIHNLAGNTKATKEVRTTTGKHLPENFAEWTLESLYAGLHYWAYTHYENTVHGTLMMTPREALEQSLQQSGSRPHKQIILNREFLIMTSPIVSRGGVRAIDPQRGVKVNDHYYWAPIFSTPKLAKTSVPVRSDPWDASSVYVYVGNEWVQAVDRTLLVLGQLTEYERRALSAEYQSKAARRQKMANASEQSKLEFLETFTPQGALDKYLECQSDNKEIYVSLGIANITPVQAPACRPLLQAPVASSKESTTAEKTKRPRPRKLAGQKLQPLVNTQPLFEVTDEGLLELDEF